MIHGDQRMRRAFSYVERAWRSWFFRSYDSGWWIVATSGKPLACVAQTP